MHSPHPLTNSSAPHVLCGVCGEPQPLTEEFVNAYYKRRLELAEADIQRSKDPEKVRASIRRDRDYLMSAVTL